MIGKIIGAIAGEEYERRRGESGAKGALAGVLAVGLAKRVVPLALVIAGVFVAKKLVDQARGE